MEIDSSTTFTPRIINTPVNEILILLLTTIIGIIYSVNMGGNGSLGPSFTGTILTLLIITFAVANQYISGSSLKDPSIYFTIIVVGSIAFVGVALTSFSILFQRSIENDKKPAYFTPNSLFASIGMALFLFGLISTVFISIYGTASNIWLYFVDWYSYLLSLAVASCILLSAVITSY
jgi:hypothetical protein